MLGSEEEGLLNATLAHCDEVIAITGAGRIESLNVLSVAAILIYALSAR